MTEQLQTSAAVRIIGPQDGDKYKTEGLQDRFLIDGSDTGQRFALVEHSFERRALAAPLHLHRSEDEFSFVVEGRMGAILGGQEVFGDKGDLIFKPRNQWHTFWNAGDERLVVLEMISPAGLEQLFRKMGELALAAELDPDRIAELAATHDCEVDMEGTLPLVDRHGLDF